MGRKPGSSRKRKRIQVTDSAVAEEPVAAASDEKLDHPAFSNELIVKGILQCLRFKDLLHCSLVSRKWNFVAREELRKRNCLAAIRDENGGSDVKALNSLLSRMIHSPFRGLSVHLYKNTYEEDCGGGLVMDDTDSTDSDYEDPYARKSDDSSSEEEYRGVEDEDDEPREKSDYTDLLDSAALEALSTVLAKLDIKYLKLTAEEHAPLRYRRGTHCNMYKRLRRNWGIAHSILKNPSSTVEGICFDMDYKFDHYWDLYCKIFNLRMEEVKLPNLKTLELFPNNYDYTMGDGECLPMMEAFLGAAPNLQHLHMVVDATLLGTVLPWSRAHLVKDFSWELHSRIDLSEIEAFTLQEPKLKKLNFYTRVTQISSLNLKDQRRVCTILNDLLRSSQDTLQKLSVDHHDLILMVSQWDMPVLSQLKHLEVSYNRRVDDEGAPLEKIDFQEYFPQLTKVTFTESAETGTGPFDFYVSDHFRNQTSSYSCSTVKVLHWKFENSILVGRLKMCQKIFPNVKRLHLEIRPNAGVSFPPKLWTVWPDLLSLKFTTLNIDDKNYNLEILGISKKDDDRIMAGVVETPEVLRMIPVNPCLFSLPKLRRISFRFTHSTRPFPCEEDCTSEPIFLSAAAVPLIRSRMPGLSFEVERKICSFKEKCHLALTQLGSFVESVERADVMPDIEITPAKQFRY